MSKLFNARSKAAALVVAALALTGVMSGCGRQGQDADPSGNRSSTVVTPELSGIDTVAEEEPAVARSTWRAANDAARTVAGNLRVSLEGARGGPVVFAFANGITIRAQPIDVVGAETRSGVPADGNILSFAAILEADPRVRAHLYRVEEDDIASSAVRGGLCGRPHTTYLAVSEYVGSSSDWVFKIAAFKNEQAPGTQGQDPGLCGVYFYVAPP